MGMFRSILFVLFIGGFCGRMMATTIRYEAIDLTDASSGQDLWQYNYFVSGRTFSANQSFTIFFDYHLFGQLEDPPPTVNPDWAPIVLQPDLNLPDNGAYDALTVVNGPSLTDTFSLNFIFLGPGKPGSQPFTINQFDSTGNLLQVLETGHTIPKVVPEPSTYLLFITGLGALLYRAARRQVR